jgi:hypothetical protein
MNQFVISLITIIIFISIGFISKTFGLLDKQFGKKLYKFLFTIPLPIVVFISLASNPISSDLIALPIIGALVALSLVIVAYMFGKGMKLNRKRIGTLMTAAGITSTLSFALPFILEFYGEDAGRFLYIYDFGGAIVVWTLVYYLGGIMGNKRDTGIKKSLLNFLKNPMLWALIVGVIFALIDIPIHDYVLVFNNKLAALVSPLILIGIGIFLDLSFFTKSKNLLLTLVSVLLVMVVSVSIAYGLTLLLGVEGIAQKVVLISAIAPSGALTVPFAVEHELDTEFASSLVAATMFFALILTPLLIAL